MDQLSPGFPQETRGCLVSDSGDPEISLNALPGLGAARTIVIKPNLGYQKPHPATVRAELIALLVRQLVDLAPQSTVHIVEGVTFAGSSSDSFQWHGWDKALAGMPVQFHDCDTTERADFINPSPSRKRFESFTGPAILSHADLAISVAPLKRTILNGAPLLSGTVKNFFGLLPRDVYRARSPHSRGMLHRPSVHEVVTQVAQTFLPYFHLGIIDLHSWYDSPDWHPDRGKSVHCGKVVSGTDLPSVDRAACDLVGVEPSGYLVSL